METVIRKYGYEYHLVQVERGTLGVPEPKAFGMKGFALKAVKKIKNDDIKN